MEDEIKVGEWIRTLRGDICKVLNIRKKSRFISNRGHACVSPERYFVDNPKRYSISKPYVKKHSSNIIDLIEAKDMVNNKMVKKVFIDPFTKKKRLELEGTEINWQGDMSSIYCEANEIKVIITKEQLASIEYKVME